MRNRNDREPDKSRVHGVNPWDYSSFEDCQLVCAKCKKNLLLWPIGIALINGDEFVERYTRMSPIIERALHMHRCERPKEELLEHLDYSVRKLGYFRTN